MEEHEVMTPETEADYDAGWYDDEPGGHEADQPEEAGPEGQSPPPGDNRADGQRPETKPAGSAGEDTPAPGQETGPADQPERFVLKNRDETRQVTREELIAMAQKGWDYDTVRAERDQLRAYRDEADPAMSLVKSFAQRSGMSVSDYLDYCRRQEIMSAGVNEETARAQVAMERQQAAMQAQQEQQQKQQQEQQKQKEEADRRAEARRAELRQFMTAYPDVRADSIPAEVWAMVQGGTPLLTAYTMHQNSSLRAELDAERQNSANRAKSPGSMQTAGESKADPYDDGWYDDD